MRGLPIASTNRFIGEGEAAGSRSNAESSSTDSLWSGGSGERGSLTLPLKGGRDDPPVSGGHSTTAAVRPQWGLGETDRDESDVGDLGEYRPVGGMPALPSGEYDLVGAAESSRDFKSCLVEDTPLPRRKEG